MMEPLWNRKLSEKLQKVQYRFSGQGSILLKFTKALYLRKFIVSHFSKLETDHIEKVVTGLFYSCANIQTTMSILVPAIDRRIYIIKRSSTVNIRIFIYDSLFHTSNSG